VSAAVVEAAAARRVAMRRRLGHHLDVVLHLVRLELAQRHRGSLFGWVWSLGPPLFQLGATYFVFTRVIPLGIDDYPVFLLVGILAWNWFSRAVTDGVSALEARRDLVRRPGFAAELLPLTSVIVGLVDYVLALPVLFIAIGVTSGFDPEMALLPVLLLVQLVLAVGLGLAFSPLQVFLRDVRQIVSVAVSIGFWLTPVFYRPTALPDALSFLYDLNPMAHLVEAHRNILLEGRLPDGSALGLVALASFGVLAVGYAIFTRLRYSVPEHL
jgi:lipopolysaccharide transport system permease protein